MTRAQFLALDLNDDPSKIDDNATDALITWANDLHNKSTAYIRGSLFTVDRYDSVRLRDDDLLDVITLLVFIQVQMPYQVLENSAEKRQIYDLFRSIRSSIPQYLRPTREQVATIIQVLIKALNLTVIVTDTSSNAAELVDAFSALADEMRRLTHN